jgi:hypothetical protein
VSADNRSDDPLKPGNAIRPSVEAAPDDPTLRLLAEEVQVAKETFETGRVRVSAQTDERETLIDDELARERVEIETIPVGRRIDVVLAVRREGDTTIVPVVEEVDAGAAVRAVNRAGYDRVRMRSPGAVLTRRPGYHSANSCHLRGVSFPA